MSNYPPTPSFGGPFNPTSRPPPLSAVTPHNKFQWPDGPKTTSHVSQDTRSVLAANSFAFNGNTQVLPPGPFGSALPSPPFLNLAHFPPGSLPPPPFPPVPIPQHGFPPQFSILNQKEDPNVAMEAQVQLRNNSFLSSQGTVPHIPHCVRMVGLDGDREEGELSDRDVKVSSVKSTATRQFNHIKIGESQLPPIPVSSDHQDTWHPSVMVPAQGDNFISFLFSSVY